MDCAGLSARLWTYLPGPFPHIFAVERERRLKDVLDRILNRILFCILILPLHGMSMKRGAKKEVTGAHLFISTFATRGIEFLNKLERKEEPR